MITKPERREKKLQPSISAQNPTAGALEQIKGKTIADWEFGTVELGSECHLSERIILHFTDGSKMTLDIGSNAYNVSSEVNNAVQSGKRIKLRPSDFHADLYAKYEL